MSLVFVTTRADTILERHYGELDMESEYFDNLSVIDNKCRRSIFMKSFISKSALGET